MNNKPRPSPGEQGVALISVMLVLSILALIGLAIATMGQGHMAVTVAQSNSENAYQGGEAAALYACDEYSRMNPLPAASAYPVPMAPSSLTRPVSATNPDLIINATIFPGPWPNFVPPGCAQRIQIPQDHAYVVGCGNVRTNSTQPTVRHVGVMVRKSAPGGVYFYGAYANNTLDAKDNQGIIDAWNSKGGADPYTGAPAQKVPFVELEGAGATAKAEGQDIWGNVNGPTVKTNNKTNFNNYGSARIPGTSLEMPEPPWPTAGPSPATDLTVTGMVTLDSSSGVNLAYKKVHVKSGGELILRGNGPWQFQELEIDGGALWADKSTGVNVAIYVGQDATAKKKNVGIGNGNLKVEKAGVIGVKNGSEIHDPSSLAIFYCGPKAEIKDNNTKVVAGLVCTNPDVKVDLKDSASVFGSVISRNDISIKNNANLHYDISMRTANTNANGGTTGGGTLGIVSHQRL